jgi:hypothetical protein
MRMRTTLGPTITSMRVRVKSGNGDSSHARACDSRADDNHVDARACKVRAVRSCQRACVRRPGREIAPTSVHATVGLAIA